jgi:hypothetical protein
MKGGISKKLAVRITYKDGKTEFIPMLTGEFYKFITRFNKTNHIDHFKVEKDVECKTSNDQLDDMGNDPL